MPTGCRTSSCMAAPRCVSARRWWRGSRLVRSPFFLLSLKAGGTGLNLTRADHVIHVDRWWNPAVEDQATDRAHRIGQTRAVQVHRLLTRGTIEERIGELLTRKRGLADSVLSKGEAALTELSNADLRDLVTLRQARLMRARPMTSVVFPRVPPRRGAARTVTWWGRAWIRAVEEAAYTEGDLVAGRALSRSGRIGGIIVGPGTFAAAVDDPDGMHTASGTIPVLEAPQLEALVETVAAEAGRVAALLAGELPHDLAEHAEEAGVELVPYGGELGSACTCGAWVDPCSHVLGMLHQLAWHLDTDPLLLFHLRGLPREDLLGELHQRVVDQPAVAVAPADEVESDLEAGLDAAVRAGRLLMELGLSPD